MRKRSLLSTLLLLTLVSLAGTSARLSAQTTAKSPASATTTASPQPKTQPLDLNTATADQLKTLPGIGDAYAKRIIDNRPYTAKNQIATRGIVPQTTYDKIKDSIVAHRPAKS